MGNNLEDGLRIDMIVDCQEDFNLPLIGIAREKDEKEKVIVLCCITNMHFWCSYIIPLLHTKYF